MSAHFAPVALRPHAPDSPLTGIQGSGSLDAAGRLQLEFQLHGDLQQIRLAAVDATSAHLPVRRDELWRHTCLELFARAGESPDYLELNFALNGDWAAYAFDDYRAGQRAIDASNCVVHLVRHDADLQVHISLLVPLLAATARVDTWHLGLAAVIESQDGVLSYWALHHPRRQPDFHDPAGFSCALSAPAL